MFDVLEHLPNDEAVLHNLHRLLKPDGYLMLTVPANRSLFSYFDEASHHHRRYEYDELECKLIQAGYRIEFMTYYMATIFPMVWLGRRLDVELFAIDGYKPGLQHWPYYCLLPVMISGISFSIMNS